ncbi:MAG: hypothetical protein EXS64_00310 [Candidatus Latescibacteria bacterium]|nr:hypothetical protein [Candidatus Latescibacterota bacterium]
MRSPADRAVRCAWCHIFTLPSACG